MQRESADDLRGRRRFLFLSGIAEVTGAAGPFSGIDRFHDGGDVGATLCLALEEFSSRQEREVFTEACHCPRSQY